LDALALSVLFLVLGVWADLESQSQATGSYVETDIRLPLVTPTSLNFDSDANAVSFKAVCVQVPIHTGMDGLVLSNDMPVQYGMNGFATGQPITITKKNSSELSVVGLPPPAWAMDLDLENEVLFSSRRNGHALALGAKELAIKLALQSCGVYPGNYDFSVTKNAPGGAKLLTVTVVENSSMQLKGSFNIGFDTLFDALQAGTSVAVVRAADHRDSSIGIDLPSDSHSHFRRPWLYNRILGSSQRWFSFLSLFLWCCTGPLQPEYITPHLAAFSTYTFGGSFAAETLYSWPIPRPFLVVFPLALWPALVYCSQRWLGAKTLSNVQITRPLLDILATLQLSYWIANPGVQNLVVSFLIEGFLVAWRVKENNFLAVACMVILPVISAVLKLLTG
jgi:hypothetical protein